MPTTNKTQPNGNRVTAFFWFVAKPFKRVFGTSPGGRKNSEENSGSGRPTVDPETTDEASIDVASYGAVILKLSRSHSRDFRRSRDRGAIAGFLGAKPDDDLRKLTDQYDQHRTEAEKKIKELTKTSTNERDEVFETAVERLEDELSSLEEKRGPAEAKAQIYSDAGFRDREVAFFSNFGYLSLTALGLLLAQLIHQAFLATEPERPSDFFAILLGSFRVLYEALEASLGVEKWIWAAVGIVCLLASLFLFGRRASNGGEIRIQSTVMKGTDGVFARVVRFVTPKPTSAVAILLGLTGLGILLAIKESTLSPLSYFLGYALAGAIGSACYYFAANVSSEVPRELRRTISTVVLASGAVSILLVIVGGVLLVVGTSRSSGAPPTVTAALWTGSFVLLLLGTFLMGQTRKIRVAFEIRRRLRRQIGETRNDIEKLKVQAAKTRQVSREEAEDRVLQLQDHLDSIEKGKAVEIAAFWEGYNVGVNAGNVFRSSSRAT